MVAGSDGGGRGDLAVAGRVLGGAFAVGGRGAVVAGDVLPAGLERSWGVGVSVAGGAGEGVARGGMAGYARGVSQRGRQPAWARGGALGCVGRGGPARPWDVGGRDDGSGGGGFSGWERSFGCGVDVDAGGWGGGGRGVRDGRTVESVGGVVRRVSVEGVVRDDGFPGGLRGDRGHGGCDGSHGGVGGVAV